MPTIPRIPAKAGGAGIGSFKEANKNPTTRPVIKARMISFKIEPPFFHYLLLVSLKRDIKNGFI